MTERRNTEKCDVGAGLRPARLSVFFIFFVFGFIFFTYGCMERFMVIKTTSGANLWLDSEKVPENLRMKGAVRDEFKIPFDHYGTHIATIRAYAHNSRTEKVELSTPWYQYFPLDFFTDLIIPVTITNTHEFDFPLDKLTETDEGSLLKRAEEFRKK
jgi:hypothetical protein